MNFVKFLRTPFLQTTSERLLLSFQDVITLILHPKSCIYKRNLNKFDNDETKEDMNKIVWVN